MNTPRLDGKRLVRERGVRVAESAMAFGYFERTLVDELRPISRPCRRGGAFGMRVLMCVKGAVAKALGRQISVESSMSPFSR